MSARVEAAAKAWDKFWGDRYGDDVVEEMGDEIQVALAAADQIMFSEAAIERAVLFAHTAGGMPVAKCREVVRAVVAALREET